MSPDVLMCVLAGVLIGCGVHLLLARSVIRALLGFLLMGNGINLLFVVAAGPRGRAPIVNIGEGPMADPPACLRWSRTPLRLCWPEPG